MLIRGSAALVIVQCICNHETKGEAGKGKKGRERERERKRKTHSSTQFPDYSHDEVPPVVY